MSRKIRLLRKLERHLRRHPNDKVARAIVEALREGRYRWEGRKLIILRGEQ